MSWTTSPGMRRGRTKTIREAIRSDGRATTRRRRMYVRMAQRGRGAGTAAAARLVLLVDPGGHEPAAVVEAVVRHVVLDVGLPGRDDLDRAVHAEVGLLGHVALDVEDDLLALADVEGPPLEIDHVAELRIVHVPHVERLAGHVPPVEIGLGIGPGPAEPHEHVVELPVD